MNVLEEAENYARLQSIHPTSLLILLTGGPRDFWFDKMKPNCSLIADVYRKDDLRSWERVDTFGLHALRANLKIVIISALRVDGFKKAPGYLYRNIRHKCILHIYVDHDPYPGKSALTTVRSPRPKSYLTGILWFSDGSRDNSLTRECYHNYEQLIAFEVDASLQSCPFLKIPCTKNGFELSKTTGGDSPIERHLDIHIQCNGTTFQVTFKLSTMADETRLLEQHMLTRYLVNEPDVVECFSYIGYRSTSVAALVDPLDRETWIMILAAFLMSAGIISRFEDFSFVGAFCTIVTTFITVTEFRIKAQRVSYLLVMLSTLVMCLFLSIFYRNFVVSYFLDQSEHFDCEFQIDCQNDPIYEEVAHVRTIMEHSRCACSLSQKQLSRVEKPLRRRIIKANQLSFPVNRFYIESEPDRFQRGVQLPLSLTRTSSTIDRALQSDILSSSRLYYKDQYIGPRGTFTDSFVLELKLTPKRKFLEFSTTNGLLNMERYKKIQFTFALCAAVLVIVCIFEFFVI